MNHEELRLRIGANITQYRKKLGMTQAELAQKLNYSDKAVSKWERVESVPDVLTLADIAEQFGISVDILVYGDEPAPAPAPAVKTPEMIPEVKKHNRKIIQWLVSILVWIVATSVYVMVDSFDLPYGWLAFFFAVPAHAITLLSLRSAWGQFGWNMVLISVIMWGSLVFLHAVIYIAGAVNIWRMFLLGLLGQAAIILWFRLQKKPKEEACE